METVYSTETFSATYNTARRRNSEYHEMNFYFQEDVKSYESTFS